MWEPENAPGKNVKNQYVTGEQRSVHIPVNAAIRRPKNSFVNEPHVDHVLSKIFSNTSTLFSHYSVKMIRHKHAMKRW